MTYTNIPPISYIFVGVTTAILSYVTWAELQEELPQEEIPQEEIPQEEIPQEEIQQEEVKKEEQGLIGGKKRSTTKKKRNKKRKKQTKHTKLKSK